MLFREPASPTGTPAPPDPTHNVDQGRQISTWRATLGGTLLFFVAGLFLVLNEIPRDWPVPDWLLPLWGMLPILLLLLSAVAFGLGWIQGFPRWSYPYVGNLLLFSLYLMNVAPPEPKMFGYTFGRSDLWAALVWLPALVMLAFALLVSHSLRPALRLVANIWHDWTLWTWALFGFLPWLVAISFDEMDQRFSLPFMVFTALVTLATALLYLRSPRHGIRALALVGGTFLLVAIGVGAPAFYWQQHSGIDILASIKVGTVLLVVFFAPAVLLALRGLLRRAPGAYSIT